MSGPAAHFDLAALFAAIDTARDQRSLTWSALSNEVGVAASTIRRFGEAKDAEADGVLALVRWLGVEPEAFVAAPSVEGVPLPVSGDGYVRVDMNLVRETPAGQGLAPARSRMSIQQLLTVAHESGRTVASLTRRSDV